MLNKKQAPCFIFLNKNIRMGTFIHRDVVVSLVKTYINNNAKKNHTGIEPTYLPIDKENDTRAVWFSKEEIDELFKRNEEAGKTMGLRIYFGMHEDNPIQNEALGDIHREYIGQNTVVLVCTHNGEDCLSTNSSVALSLEEGSLCPPPRPCGSILESEL